jgi:hypothetical protein
MRETTLYLGAPEPAWIGRTEVPLCVSYGRLRRLVRKLPRCPQHGSWMLDSRGFTELTQHGGWTISPETYVADIVRYDREIGGLSWAAHQDWPCEDQMLARTGLTELEHQRRTVANYVRCRALWDEAAQRGETNPSADNPIMPVVQASTPEGYRRCWDLYHDPDARTRELAGRPWPAIDLDDVEVVGIGSVCTVQSDTRVVEIIRAVQECSRTPGELPTHAFGMKATGLDLVAEGITSCDSQAWSRHARGHNIKLAECTEAHQVCNYCLTYATRWWADMLAKRGLWDVRPWWTRS